MWVRDCRALGASQAELDGAARAHAPRPLRRCRKPPAVAARGGLRARRLRVQVVAVRRHGRLQGGRRSEHAATGTPPPMTGSRPRSSVGGRAARAARARPATRSCSTPAAAPARSRRAGPARAPRHRLRRRRGPVDGRPRPGGARRPGHRHVPGPGRAGAARAGRRRVLQRHLPLDPRSRRAVRRAAPQHEARRPPGGPVRRPRQHRRASAGSPTRSPREAPFAPYFADWQRPWNYATAEETAERLARAGFADVRRGSRIARPSSPSPRPFITTVCLVRHLDPLPEDLRERVRRPRAGRAATPARARLRAPEHARPASR